MKRYKKFLAIGSLSVICVLAFCLCNLGVNNNTYFNQAYKDNNANDAIQEQKLEGATLKTITNAAQPTSSTNSADETQVAKINKSDFVYDKDTNEDSIVHEKDANEAGRTTDLFNGLDSYVPDSNLEDDLHEGTKLYYKLEETTETIKGKEYKCYILHIRASQKEDYNEFDSSQPAPWVTSEQYKIRDVDIEEKVYPDCTIGWFGCTTKESGSRLSDIKKIEGLDNIDMQNVTNASFMFMGSNLLESVETDGTFAKSIIRITDAHAMCYYTNLSNSFLNLIAKRISYMVSNTRLAFGHNDKLKSFDLPDTNFDKVKNSSFMFYNNSKLETIKANTLIANRDVNAQGMFYGCGALKTITLDAQTD